MEGWAIIGLFVLTHPPTPTNHRLKATIDNCLTTENSTDCDFPPDFFLLLEIRNLVSNDYIRDAERSVLIWRRMTTFKKPHQKNCARELWTQIFGSESFRCKSIGRHVSFKIQIRFHLQRREQWNGILPSSEVSAPRHFGMADAKKAAIVKEVILRRLLFQILTAGARWWHLSKTVGGAMVGTLLAPRRSLDGSKWRPHLQIPPQGLALPPLYCSLVTFSPSRCCSVERSWR